MPLPARAELRPSGEFWLSPKPRAASSSSFPIDVNASSRSGGSRPPTRFALCPSSFPFLVRVAKRAFRAMHEFFRELFGN
jgi:hypothetical protein